MRYLIGLSLFSLLLQAAPWSESYSDALAAAQKEGKAVYLLITAPECRWCRKFKQTTLTDGAVRKRLERLAVGVEVYRGQGDYPKHLKAPMVPMHYFLAADGSVLVKMPGHWNIEDFMSILDDVERKRK